MLSSPEILLAGASVVDTSGGRANTPQWPGVFGPTGVQEQGAGTRGALGNLRDPSVSTDMAGSGTGITTPRPSALRRAAGSEQDARVVSPNEGNEVRRDGRMGVGAFRSSDEAGERALRGTLWSEGDACHVTLDGSAGKLHCLTTRCKSRRRRSPCGTVKLYPASVRVTQSWKPRREEPCRP